MQQEEGLQVRGPPSRSPLSLQSRLRPVAPPTCDRWYSSKRRPTACVAGLLLPCRPVSTWRTARPPV